MINENIRTEKSILFRVNQAGFILKELDIFDKDILIHVVLLPVQRRNVTDIFLNFNNFLHQNWELCKSEIFAADYQR